MSLVLLGILNSQAAAAGGATSYDLLESQVLTSNASSVTFTGLGSYTDYKHLQIRATLRSNYASTSDVLRIRPNSDTSFIYRSHHLRGTGGAVYAANYDTNAFDIRDTLPGSSNNSNVYGSYVIDLLDFNNTKYKTFRALSGHTDINQWIFLSSGLWQSTASISSLYFDVWNGTAFVTGSRFSLYGVK